MNALQTHFWAVRDYLAPVLRESKFKEHGRITPEEFVAAGDFLSYKFPTWTWSNASSSDAKYTREFLPPNKQYLISHGVPCLRRVSQIESAATGTSKAEKLKEGTASADERILNFNEGHDGEEVKGRGGDEDWLATHLDEESSAAQHVTDIEDMPDTDAPAWAKSMTTGEEDDLAAKVAGTSIDDSGHANLSRRGESTNAAIGDIPDIDDEEDDELGGLGEGVEEADDPATHFSRQAGRATSDVSKKENRLLSVRTYDCLITYDKYYQTPRMWLVGYNEAGRPLKPAEIFEDISSDYAQKTVTVEPFPHANMSTASIHPCKHASVMKKVIERMNAGLVAEQQRAKVAAASASASGVSGAGVLDAEKKKKKGWGLGGAMKKVTGKEADGGGASLSTEAADDERHTEVEGLRVDQYLLIFLKFMASIVPAIEIDATQAV
ncbi:hypothetical protein CBS101457_000840 [Exobasidium rhododendri]|nr:hypothetical protein CBS101457_000840 [Exobasidium rhododendri]